MLIPDSICGDRTEWAEQEGHRNLLTSAEMSKLRLWTCSEQFPKMGSVPWEIEPASTQLKVVLIWKAQFFYQQSADLQHQEWNAVLTLSLGQLRD